MKREKQKKKNKLQEEATAEPTVISMNYPNMVPLGKLLTEASRWSGKKFIMDPSLNRSVQIFAPNLLAAEDAFQLLIASLETVGLRALPFEGGIIKIVEASNLKIKV